MTTRTPMNLASNLPAHLIAHINVKLAHIGCQPVPLADFGTVNFAESTINGSTMTTGTPIEMVSSRNQPEAIPGNLSNGGFSDTWQ